MKTEIVSIKNSQDEKVLNEESVVSIYSRCVLGNNDFDSQGLTCNFIIGEGVSFRSTFSAERLNDQREVIAGFIDQLYDIEHAPSFMKLSRNSKGESWTENDLVVELLVQMGTATGMLTFLYPPEIWEFLPGKVPYVEKTLYSVDRKQSGIDAKEYVKIFGSEKENV